jgi:hypothetical protein
MNTVGILSAHLRQCSFLVAICLILATTMAKAEPITEQRAHAIGVDAYLYFYPLVTMDLTRKQLTNVETGKGFGGPMNTFANVPAYPTAQDRGVVRPNFDTLYSSGWLDLTSEPMVVSLPDTSGRYYLLPMLDMWTDVFASPGWRTTGTQAQTVVIAPLGWRPNLRDKLIDEFKLPKDTQLIDAPTPYVWIIGRIKTDGPSEYDAVHKLQAALKITPLSRWGKTPEPITFKPDPTVDMERPPKVQVDGMSAGDFFTYAAELLKVHPPHLTDQPIIAQMKKIGIEPGKSFDIGKVDPASARLGHCAARRSEVDGLEGREPREASQRLVHEHGHDGSLWQLLSQACNHHSTWPRGEPARGRNLSNQPVRQYASPAGRSEQIHNPLREGRTSSRRRLLVDHALRQ